VDNRLYRSVTDRQLAGVAGGLAAWLGADPSVVRVVWVVLAILSGGIFVLVYLVMAIVVPQAPPGWTPRSQAGASQGWGPQPGWGPAGTPGGPAGTPGGPASGGTWTAPPGAPGGTPGTSWPPDWNRQPAGGPKPLDTGRAGIVAGVILVVLGVWFLVAQYVDVNWQLVWPVVIIVIGGLLIAGAVRRAR
jgi:phage shock protein C